MHSSCAFLAFVIWTDDISAYALIWGAVIKGQSAFYSTEIVEFCVEEFFMIVKCGEDNNPLNTI